MKDTSNNSAKDILIKFNAVIFIMILSAISIFCVLTLNSIITQPNTTIIGDDEVRTDKTSFDIETTNQLERLLPSETNSAADQQLPTGRINPFAE